MKTELKKYSKEVTKIIQKVAKTGIDSVSSQDNDYSILEQSIGFLNEQFGAEIKVVTAEKSDKKKSAIPGKVAIVIE